VVGVARRSEKIEEISKKLGGNKDKLYAIKADFSKEEDILRTFKWTSENVGPVSILVNNAAVYFHSYLYNGKTEEWKASYDLNVIGLSIATREALRIMRQNNIDGHIININSVVGHKVVLGVNMYSEQSEELKKLREFLLESEDCADAVAYVLSTPPHVQIQELTIKPLGEFF
ncbi:hypothetical protein NQ314_021306, partial [Rhamnusium bicolor]